MNIVVQLIGERPKVEIDGEQPDRESAKYSAIRANYRKKNTANPISFYFDSGTRLAVATCWVRSHWSGYTANLGPLGLGRLNNGEVHGSPACQRRNLIRRPLLPLLPPSAVLLQWFGNACLRPSQKVLE